MYQATDLPGGSGDQGDLPEAASVRHHGGHLGQAPGAAVTVGAGNLATSVFNFPLLTDHLYIRSAYRI